MTKVIFHTFDMQTACRFGREFQQVLKGIKHSIKNEEVTEDYDYILELDSIAFDELLNLCKKVMPNSSVKTTKNVIDIY